MIKRIIANWRDHLGSCTLIAIVFFCLWTFTEMEKDKRDARTKLVKQLRTDSRYCVDILVSLRLPEHNSNEFKEAILSDQELVLLLPKLTTSRVAFIRNDLSGHVLQGYLRALKHLRDNIENPTLDRAVAGNPDVSESEWGPLKERFSDFVEGLPEMIENAEDALLHLN